MSIINQTQLKQTIFETLAADFDLDEDAVADLMTAVTALVDHAEIRDEPTSHATEDILALALAFGQTHVGGSRVDYAASDIIKAFDRHLNITKLAHNYLQSLIPAIRRYAVDPDRELATINHLSQIVPDL